jgi:23S rRNA (adenine2503-C2)-methyltransferase
VSSELEGTHRPSAWEQRPGDLAALGWAGDARRLFARLQRGEPLGRAAALFVGRHLDVALPRIVSTSRSRDGATRLLLELEDGARIEAVHMPRATVRPRITVCLSSQVGCAMGCTFCATARLGLRRQLRAGEIVGQLLAVLRAAPPGIAEGRAGRAGEETNLVFMGMGEPLQSPEILERALDVLCDPAGLAIAPRRITVSTVGHVPGIDRLAAFANRPRLAVSVNAASQEQRRSLMPIARAFSLDALRDALRRWPRDPHEKVTLEYVLLAGTNDDLASADRLADWASSLDGGGPRRHVVNLIPFNPWPGAPFAEPPPAVVEGFAARLRSRAPRLLVHRRISRGRDVAGACGNLAGSASVTPR